MADSSMMQYLPPHRSRRGCFARGDHHDVGPCASTAPVLLRVCRQRLVTNPQAVRTVSAVDVRTRVGWVYRAPPATAAAGGIGEKALSHSQKTVSQTEQVLSPNASTVDPHGADSTMNITGLRHACAERACERVRQRTQHQRGSEKADMSFAGPGRTSACGGISRNPGKPLLVTFQ